MPYQRNVGISGSGDTADVCSPMKLFDYLSAGRAIISSDLPVFHEVLNESNAVFCSPEDEHDWINAFGQLVNDDDLRERLGHQAKVDAEKYSWLVRSKKTLAKLTDLM
jgi:glycosyltransferase involved in cell wall biosynthesis